MNVNVLLGKIIKNITTTEDTILFTLDDGSQYKMYHEQDCCEEVTIDDVVGSFDDLIGSPILLAEEASSEGCPPTYDGDGSFTWTFYKFATIKGYVDIKWYGSSNGYYSESVSFIKVSD